MKVDIDHANSAFQSLINNPNQYIFLDANIFIPPDRSNLGQKAFSFESYRDFLLDPLFNEFTHLCIHESIYKELVLDKVKTYADSLIEQEPTRLEVHSEDVLSYDETVLFNSYIRKLAVHSQYDPDRDTSKDRGEVRSLSYMAVKQYLYFAANDALPIRLIKEADKLNTGLDTLGAIQSYEIVYYLYRLEKYDSKKLRILYKYMYYMTNGDKKTNPDWGTFIEGMKHLYDVN